MGVLGRNDDYKEDIFQSVNMVASEMWDCMWGDHFPFYSYV